MFYAFFKIIYSIFVKNQTLLNW